MSKIKRLRKTKELDDLSYISKMKDFRKQMIQYDAKIQKRTTRLPAYRKKKTSFYFSYRIKFYSLILLLLFASFFYIWYQINNKKNSIFSDIYRLIDKKYINNFNPLDKSTVKKKKDRGKDKTKKTDRVIDPQKKKNLALKKNQYNANIFVILLKGREVEFVSRPIDFTANRQKYFSSLISSLIKYQPLNKKEINPLDNGVRLVNIKIEANVLMINFNKKFEYTKYGYMGHQARIQQILWTIFNSKAAKIEKIAYVSFLIEGKRKMNIGGEGTGLKPFYSRKDMKKIIRAGDRA